MRFIADHDFHIHSTVSSCCKDINQTPRTIFEYAVKNNYNKICLTNHFWDENVESRANWHPDHVYSNIITDLPLPQSENVRFLLGVETDMDFDNVLGISQEKLEEFDFVIVATTHLHLAGHTVKNKIETPEEAAFYWFDKIEALLKMDLPFKKMGIAHMTCGHIFKNRTTEVIKLLQNERLYEVFQKCASKGIGIELNMKTLEMSEEEKQILLRPYYIAKDCGCKFYLGSDSHKVTSLENAKKNFEHIITTLDLKESDKFILE